MFTIGMQGTNECTAGSFSVATAAECVSAATALEHPASFGSWHHYPKGCLWYNDDVYFNTHLTGAPSVSVGTAAECVSAAAALGYQIRLGSWDYYPKGCSWHAETVYFNTHLTGGNHPDNDIRPICSSTCSGPCLFAYMCECVSQCYPSGYPPPSPFIPFFNHLLVYQYMCVRMLYT